MSGNDQNEPRSVLITGTSSGIGAACALDLDKRGFRVFAGVRKEADADRLRSHASPRLIPVLIDVTDDAAIEAAVETVSAAVGGAGLAGLVNNAGITIPGPLEFISRDQFRRQLEVNVLGTHAVTRAFLPLVRAATGRIVILSSIAGFVTPPYWGPYSASKHALEAIADTLRLELRHWRIKVSIVEPDSIVTPIWSKLQSGTDALRQDLPEEVRELYRDDLDHMQSMAQELEQKGLPVERVVKAVRHALCARRPKVRYPVGFRAHLAAWAKRFIQDRHLDWFLLRLLGYRRAGRGGSGRGHP